MGGRGTREEVIESPYQNNSNQYLQFKKKCHVQGQGQVKGQRHGFQISRHRLRTFNSSGPKISINAPEVNEKNMYTLHAYRKYLQVKVRSQKVTMC